jgi:hypothetical protein
MTDSSRRNDLSRRSTAEVEVKADIVDRLRDVSRGGWPDADEAAAEIDRLRARLDRIGLPRRSEAEAGATEMTTLMERLRQAATPGTPVGELFAEAADEIERLRAALDEIAVLFDRSGIDMPDLAAIARAALGEPKP